VGELIMAEYFKLEGTNQIINALSALNSRETDKLINFSLRRALNENVVKPLRNTIPYTNSKKNIKVIKDKEFQNSYFGGVTKEAFYLRFVDKGTKERTTKSGANRGSITGNNKISNFINSSVNSTVEYFNKDFAPNLIKNIKRKLKRINK
jgi:hypothetical protein